MDNRRFTDLELERQLAGDLPADRAFDQHATDADRARLAELRAEHEAYMRSIDVDNEVLRIQQRVARATPEPVSRRWLRWLAPAGALAAAAAVVLVLVRRGGDHPQRDDNDIQLKGDEVALVVYVATESGAQPLAYDPHTRLLPGAIALDATPGDERFFALYSARPFALDAVKPALEQNQPLPPGISKAEVVLEKKLAP